MRLRKTFLDMFNESLITNLIDNYVVVDNESFDEILPWTTISVFGDMP